MPVEAAILCEAFGVLAYRIYETSVIEYTSINAIDNSLIGNSFADQRSAQSIVKGG